MLENVPVAKAAQLARIVVNASIVVVVESVGFVSEGEGGMFLNVDNQF